MVPFEGKLQDKKDLLQRKTRLILPLSLAFATVGSGENMKTLLQEEKEAVEQKQKIIMKDLLASAFRR